MAAAIMRQLYGKFVFVDSVGARPSKIDLELDPLIVEVLDEIGVEIGKHKPKRFEDLEDTSFDIIVTLSPEAHHTAMELTRTQAAEVEYWRTFDPTIVEGSREQRLDAYRLVRDELMRRIRVRFAVDRAND
ncbi:MAG: low molecular weight phosphatase family protein [Proteobacteria bacterium]|nr:low molecular weight phosphatase family protein [Pseudomonadota bacterium]